MAKKDTITVGEPLKKKRKRDGNEDRAERPTRKKQRSKSDADTEVDESSQLQPDGVTEEDGEHAELNSEFKDVARLDKTELSLSKAAQQDGTARQAPSWTLSKPIGGKIMDIDPIFSIDEKYESLDTFFSDGVTNALNVDISSSPTTRRSKYIRQPILFSFGRLPCH
jgi:hypothetical protein